MNKYTFLHKKKDLRKTFTDYYTTDNWSIANLFSYKFLYFSFLKLAILIFGFFSKSISTLIPKNNLSLAQFYGAYSIRNEISICALISISPGATLTDFSAISSAFIIRSSLPAS